MRGPGRVFLRTIFWSYERGTWPYDVMVAAIVLFVLFSPRSWFHDQPHLGPPPNPAQIEFLGEDPAGGTKTYRIDARLLASPIRTPELDRDLHQALRKNVTDLRGENFRIVRIEPIRGESGTVVYYDVSLKP